MRIRMKEFFAMTPLFQRGGGAMLCIMFAFLAACGTGSTSSPGTTASGGIKLEAQCNNLDGLNGSLTPTGNYAPLPATDGDGAPIVVPAKPPQTIISVSPTDSEIVAALGASNRLAAIDHFTNYPQSILTKPVVTDSNGKLLVEQILALKPDLVLAYGGETDTLGDATLRKAGINVVSLPYTVDLPHTMGDILLAGELMGATAQANTVVARMERCVATITQAVAGKTAPSVYMEIDYSTPGKPYTVGQGSFEDDLIHDAGGQNIFATNTNGGGYPQVSDETVIAANPQVIILSEPVTGTFVKPQDRPAWQSIVAVQNGRVFIVNDDLLSRAGPRIVMGLAAVAEDLWPTLFS
jgi:iron complex transport system substrate-binding protein